MLIAAVVVALGACGGSYANLPADATRLLEAGERVVVLGPTTGQTIDEDELRATAARAAEAGTELRVVVSGDGRELIDPSPIVDRFGGTAITYITYAAEGDDLSVASRDLTNAQLIRATDAAATRSAIDESTEAFVDLLVTEGVQTRSFSLARLLLWIALGAAAVFLVAQFLGFRKARAKTRRRRAEFDRRKASLAEWIGLLRVEADELVSAQQRFAPAARRNLDEARTQVGALGSAVEGATTLSDLDANEIRVARAAMKLRTLRSELG